MTVKLPSSDYGTEISELLPTLRDHRALDKVFAFANVSRLESARQLRIRGASVFIFTLYLALKLLEYFGTFSV